MSMIDGAATSRDRSAVGPAAALALKLGDYLELTKPRIVVLELFVAAIAACLATPHSLQIGVVLHAMIGTALVAASASIANQWIERENDARMRRTAERPIVAGRVSTREAAALCAASGILGAAWLATMVNLTTAALGLFCWVVYAVIYTPLKTRTPLNTAVGAVAGLLPLLMGWTATGVPLNVTAMSLAGVLFLWQFPHFMAIAWLYRREYAAAGHKMLSVVDPTGIRCGMQAVITGLALLPVSLIPALSPTSGSPMVYGLWAIGLGGVQLALAVRFAVNRDEASARMLLKASLVYLPALFAVLLMVSV